MTRREFLQRSSGTALATGIGLSALAESASKTRAQSANDKVVMGFIGIAGRGGGLMGEFMGQPDVEVGAVCDVFQPRLSAALQKAGGKAKAYHDFRDLLAQEDIDGVCIATPPHWHALIAILACQAGKDVYVEKPMSLYPAEARATVKAAKENNRVTQVGTQIHAGENFRRAVEIVRSGALGKITCVRVYVNLNEAPGPVGAAPEQPPPADLDWNLWLGPLPESPYREAWFHDHKHFRELVRSWLNELGPHIADLAFWAMDPGPPLAAAASGGRWIMQDDSTVPDTMDVIWDFKDFNMTYMHTASNGFEFNFGPPPDGGRRLGVIFQGANGTLWADYGSHKVIPDGDRLKPEEIKVTKIPPSSGQVREFLDGIKTREQPLCNVEYHYPCHIALGLAHIAMAVGRKVHWDDQKGEIVKDREANELATPDYRKPWKLPKA